MRFAPPIPQVPRPASRRGRWLARERADDARGRFSERLLQFVFPPIAPTTSSQLLQTVTSQGSRFVRCLGLRGTTGSDQPLTGLEPASLLMRVELNGDNDFIAGNTANVASLASLFDDVTTPWFWFLSPPLLRAGDRLTVTITNTNPAIEGAPDLTPEIGLRLMDDELWQELFTRDWRAERGA